MKYLKYIQFSRTFLRLVLGFALVIFYSTRLWAQSPNDPLYPQQSYLNTINIQDAWNVTTGSSNVDIGVIATGGVYAGHEDLSNKVTIKTGRIGHDKSPLGTIGAGIAAAETNNSKGIAGINWNAPILSYDVGGEFTDEDGITTFYMLDQTVVDG